MTGRRATRSVTTRLRVLTAATLILMPVTAAAAWLAANHRATSASGVLTAACALGGAALVLTLARSVDREVSVPLKALHRALVRQRTGDRAAALDPDRGTQEVRELAAELGRLAAANRALAAEQTTALQLHELALDVARSVHGSADLHASLVGVCAMVGRDLELDRVLLMTVDEDGALRKFVQWQGDASEPLPAPPPELVSILAPVAHDLRHSGSLVVPDLVAPGVRQDAVLGELRRFASPMGLLLVPVGVTHRGLGLLACVTRDRPRTWLHPEVRAVEQVSAIVAQAIVQQRLMDLQDHQVRELRALDEQKDAFLATVSHELRTPLTSIAGYLEILRDGDLGEVTSDQDRALEVVARNAARLQGLIEDLLVLGRMEAAGLRSERAAVDLAEVARTAVELFGPTAASSGVRLVAELPERGLVVEGDAGQLERAVLNVVGNAVKFTPEGGEVVVRVWMDGRFVRVEVEDDGIGIPSEDLARLSERFFRATNATAAEIPGTGLGLTIVRGIVEGHGGVVDIGSAEGYGTTIGLVLPVALDVRDAPVAPVAGTGSSRGAVRRPTQPVGGNSGSRGTV